MIVSARIHTADEVEITLGSPAPGLVAADFMIEGVGITLAEPTATGYRLKTRGLDLC